MAKIAFRSTAWNCHNSSTRLTLRGVRQGGHPHARGLCSHPPALLTQALAGTRVLSDHRKSLCAGEDGPPPHPVDTHSLQHAGLLCSRQIAVRWPGRAFAALSLKKCGSASRRTPLAATRENKCRRGLTPLSCVGVLSEVPVERVCCPHSRMGLARERGFMPSRLGQAPPQVMSQRGKGGQDPEGSD